MLGSNQEGLFLDVIGTKILRLAPCYSKSHPPDDLLLSFGFPETALQTFKEQRNWLQGIDTASLCSLAGRYDNPIPT